MSIPATRRQQDLLRFIAGYQQHHGGVSPSLSDCAAGMGINRTSVHWLMCSLEERGQIRRLHSRQRAIEVIDQVPVPRAPDGAPLFAVTLPKGVSA